MLSGVTQPALGQVVVCSFVHWLNLSAPALFEKDCRVCGVQMQGFISSLTEADPTFPAWEFPSTGTQDDMLHPDFVSKIRRYHEMWLKINANGK
jgi:hypothetical protein